MSMIDFEDFAYKLYKKDWEDRLGTEQKLDALRDWYMNDKGLSYSEYLDEHGYNGERYSDFDSFLKNEFLDKEYMHILLKKEPLISIYEDLYKSYDFER